MKTFRTAVLAALFLAVTVLFAGPAPAAQVDPLKAPPKAKVTGPPLSPAQQTQADKLAKERLEMQIKANAERKKGEKERAEALKKAQGVGKAPATAPAKR